MEPNTPNEREVVGVRWHALDNDGSRAATWVEDDRHFTPEKIKVLADEYFPGKPLVVVTTYTETRPA